MRPAEPVLFPFCVDRRVVLRDGTVDTVLAMETAPEGRVFRGERGRWTEAGTNLDSPASRDTDVIGLLKVAVWRVSVVRWGTGDAIADQVETLFFRGHAAALADACARNAATDTAPDAEGWHYGANGPDLAWILWDADQEFADPTAH